MHSNKKFNPELPVYPHNRDIFLKAGVLLPQCHQLRPRGLPVYITEHKALDTAVWLPDSNTNKSDLPAIAVARALDRHDVQMRKVEGYYVGVISLKTYINLQHYNDQNAVTESLFECAEYRLSAYPDIDFDYKGRAMCIARDYRNLERFFPTERFAEFMGISRQ